MLQRAAYLDAVRMQVLHWTKPAAGSYLLAEVSVNSITAGTQQYGPVGWRRRRMPEKRWINQNGVTVG
jgi:hypothetical protein